MCQRGVPCLTPYLHRSYTVSESHRGDLVASRRETLESDHSLRVRESRLVDREGLRSPETDHALSLPAFEGCRPFVADVKLEFNSEA
jgi:hypothetical protein